MGTQIYGQTFCHILCHKKGKNTGNMCLVNCHVFHRHENFQEKAGIPAFFVKIYAFSFLFMMFWAFLTRFPAFLLKIVLMPGFKLQQALVVEKLPTFVTNCLFQN